MKLKARTHLLTSSGLQAAAAEVAPGAQLDLTHCGLTPGAVADTRHGWSFSLRRDRDHLLKDLREEEPVLFCSKVGGSLQEAAWSRGVR